MVLTVLGIALESVELNCIAALVVAGLMLVASSVMLRPLIEKQNQRPLHFQTSLGFSIGGASLYFYTGSAEKYHAGPHFFMEVTRPFSVCSSQCSLSWHLLVPTVHAELEVPQPTYHDKWCVFGAQCMRRVRAQHVEREVGHPRTRFRRRRLRLPDGHHSVDVDARRRHFVAKRYVPQPLELRVGLSNYKLCDICCSELQSCCKICASEDVACSIAAAEGGPSIVLASSRRSAPLRTGLPRMNSEDLIHPLAAPSRQSDVGG